MTAPGWRPLQKPPRQFTFSEDATPFTRFARVHTLSSIGDGMITIALAGSIFFSVDPSAARNKVALYLLLTIAPFAVVTPLIGPAVDRARGGRRAMVLVTTFGRAAVAFLMVGHIDNLWLFPEAFSILVLQKAYVIANRALVPKLVASEHQLVEANSKLSLLSAVGSMGGAAVGGILSLVGGPGWSAALAFVVFAVAGVASLQVPVLRVAEQPAGAVEERELRGSGIVLSASAIGVLRGIVGFMTFLLAFELRGGKEGVDLKPFGAAAGASTAVVRKINIIGDPRAPAWQFGLVVLGAGVGALVGARLAPALRRRVLEENIVLGALVLTVVGGVAAIFNGGVFGAFLLSTAVALSGGAGKLAFDSLVQRDAPDANYGRTFARFEARFQLTWVIGAFIPVVLPFRLRYGFILVTLAAAFASASYLFGVRTARRGAPIAPDDLDGETPPGADAPALDPTTVFKNVNPSTLAPGTASPSSAAAATSAGGWGSLPAGPMISAGDGVQVDGPPQPPDAAR